MDEQLLLRYLSQECTEKEAEQVEQWALSHKTNAEQLFEMERIWGLKDELTFSNKAELEKAYNQVLTNITPKGSKKKKHIFPVWIGYAAAIVIVALLSVNIFQLFWNGTEQSNYSYDNTIEVPKGQKILITLSDGTKVWLNSDSKLTYPPLFSNKSRAVQLEGEGYFEVAHDDHAPFIVNSKELNVKVLGTKFNMKAYPDGAYSVSLKEGKIAVYTQDDVDIVTLFPNEQVVYSVTTGMQVFRNIDPELKESWINGELAFSNESLEDIMKTLERKYDIQVTITDQGLAKEVFTCRTKADVSLEQILSLLKETKKLNYTIKDKKVTISKNSAYE